MGLQAVTLHAALGSAAADAAVPLGRVGGGAGATTAALGPVLARIASAEAATKGLAAAASGGTGAHGLQLTVGGEAGAPLTTAGVAAGLSLTSGGGGGGGGDGGPSIGANDDTLLRRRGRRGGGAAGGPRARAGRANRGAAH